VRLVREGRNQLAAGAPALVAGTILMGNAACCGYRLFLNALLLSHPYHDSEPERGAPGARNHLVIAC
jgi:hypothetical protein